MCPPVMCWVLLGWNKDFVTSGFVVAIICASVLNIGKAGKDGRQLDIVRQDFAVKCANFIILQTLPADRKLWGSWFCCNVRMAIRQGCSKQRTKARLKQCQGTGEILHDIPLVSCLF